MISGKDFSKKIKKNQKNFEKKKKIKKKFWKKKFLYKNLKNNHFLLLTFFENLNFWNNDILFYLFSSLLTRANHTWQSFFKTIYIKVFFVMSLIYADGRWKLVDLCSKFAIKLTLNGL